MLCQVQAARSYNMTRVMKGLSEVLKYLQVERDSLFVEKPQYRPNVFDVNCRRIRVYYNAVQVGEGELSSNRGKNDVHCTLEGRRGVFQP